MKTLDSMLGDTSVKPQPAAVRGDGCAVAVAAPQGASSVYGNIVQVAGQLSGFAKATDSCKTSLQQSILKSVGPEHPDDELRAVASPSPARCSARGPASARSLRTLSPAATRHLRPSNLPA